MLFGLLSNAMQEVDNSLSTANSLGLPTSSDDIPQFNAWRGFMSGVSNQNEILAEDFYNSELSAMRAFERESSFSSAEAQKLREWQERLSNSSYQRAVEDMKLAGLNPLLGFGLSGASTPSGSAGSSSSGSSSYPVSSVSRYETRLFSDILKSLSGLLRKI